MLSHKALAARLRLLRREGVQEVQDGVFRVSLRMALDESPRPVAIDPGRVVVHEDDTNPADLVLNPPAIDYSVDGN
jgi:hypothetical protein